MKKLCLSVAVLALVAVLVSAPTDAAVGQTCTTINDGVLKDSNGNLLVMGYDQFGYNYQAHLFNGTYDSSDRVLDGKYWGQTGTFVFRPFICIHIINIQNMYPNCVITFPKKTIF